MGEKEEGLGLIIECFIRVPMHSTVIPYGRVFRVDKTERVESKILLGKGDAHEAFSSVYEHEIHLMGG